MQKLRPDMEIGTNIQRLRKRCSLTQEEVTARLQVLGLNITRSTYAKIERNAYNIRISELVALKGIFRLDSFDPFFSGLTIECL